MLRLRLSALALVVAVICIATGVWLHSRTPAPIEAVLQPVAISQSHEQKIVYGSDGSTSLPNGFKFTTTDGVITTVAASEKKLQMKGWSDVLGTRYIPGSVDGTDVTRQLWRTVKLQTVKSDGGIAFVELARPLWWFEINNAHKVGDEVYLVMHELGIEGKAIVLGIGPCDADSREGPKESSIVTGTIKHENATVLDLVFNDQNEKPLGVTTNHPIYSRDRNGWVPAGELEIGEKVVCKDGFATLTGRSERSGRHTVYNLEVHREHTFHVADLGILVHNSCARDPRHHVFPQEFRHEFEDGLNIPIDDYTVQLPKADHIDLHRKGWNERWEDFFDQHQNPTPQQAGDFASELMDEFDISDLPLGPYNQ